MEDAILKFISEATAYIQGMGLLHIGPSPYSETTQRPLIGRAVLFNGGKRIIKYVERESGVPLSISVAVPRHDGYSRVRPRPIMRGDLVGLLFEDDGAKIRGSNGAARSDGGHNDGSFKPGGT